MNRFGWRVDRIRMNRINRMNWFDRMNRSGDSRIKFGNRRRTEGWSVNRRKVWRGKIM